MRALTNELDKLRQEQTQLETTNKRAPEDAVLTSPQFQLLHSQYSAAKDQTEHWRKEAGYSSQQVEKLKVERAKFKETIEVLLRAYGLGRRDQATSCHRE